MHTKEIQDSISIEEITEVLGIEQGMSKTHWELFASSNFDIKTIIKHLNLFMEMEFDIDSKKDNVKLINALKWCMKTTERALKKAGEWNAP